MTADSQTPFVVGRWHAIAKSANPAGLRSLLADDVVFSSPAVHEPQIGREITERYLAAAIRVLGPTWSYHRKWTNPHSAVLEFHARVDGLHVQGVDIIEWNESDRIVRFTVLVRPLRALEALVEHMGRELRTGSAR